MPIKLIASDMDGTLLAPDHRLSARTLRAVAAARAAGIEVLPVTGRGFRSAVDILRPARLDTAVCSNGALKPPVERSRWPTANTSTLAPSGPTARGSTSPK